MARMGSWRQPRPPPAKLGQRPTPPSFTASLHVTADSATMALSQKEEVSQRGRRGARWLRPGQPQPGSRQTEARLAQSLAVAVAGALAQLWRGLGAGRLLR
jgi:hypothetical protein